MLISNRTKFFLNFQPENTQMRDFLFANLGIFCFFAKFCNQTNLRVLISKMTIIFFIILACGYPNEAFSVANLGIFTFFHESLQLDKSKGADFKYDNMVLKFHLKNTQVRYFWSQIQFFLFFQEIVQLGKFKRTYFKYGNSFSKILAQKYQNEAFSVANIDIFIIS